MLDTKHPVEDHFGFIKSKAIKLVGNYGRKNCDIDDVTQELAAEVKDNRAALKAQYR